MNDEPIECHIENLGYCPFCARPLGCDCPPEQYEQAANHLLALAQDKRLSIEAHRVYSQQEARDDERF